MAPDGRMARIANNYGAIQAIWLAPFDACHAEGRGFESLQPLTFKGAVGTPLNRRQAHNSPATTRALIGANRHT